MAQGSVTTRYSAPDLPPLAAQNSNVGECSSGDIRKGNIRWTGVTARRDGTEFVTGFDIGGEMNTFREIALWLWLPAVIWIAALLLEIRVLRRWCRIHRIGTPTEKSVAALKAKRASAMSTPS